MTANQHESSENSFGEKDVAIIEALIFASDTPLSPRKIVDILPHLKESEIHRAVTQLNEQYEQNQRAFRIEKVAGGYRFFTLPEFEPFLKQLFISRNQQRLSQKALETLAIIAYRQPITRQEIEEIRGVSADGVIRTLLARNLITIAGRAEAPGSPFLYKTTKTFLEYFGLNSLNELPRLKELEELIGEDEELRTQYQEVLLHEIDPEKLGLKPNGTGSEDATTELKEENDDQGHSETK